MATIVNAKFKQKRGTEASIPVLLEGELYVCIDSKKLYVGSASGNQLISDISQLNDIGKYSSYKLPTIQTMTSNGGILVLSDDDADSSLMTNNNGEITILKPGTYILTSNVEFGYLATGRRRIDITVNGTPVSRVSQEPVSNNGSATVLLNSTVCKLNSGDVLKISIELQGATSSVDVNSAIFKAVKIK